MPSHNIHSKEGPNPAQFKELVEVDECNDFFCEYCKTKRNTIEKLDNYLITQFESISIFMKKVFA